MKSEICKNEIGQSVEKELMEWKSPAIEILPIQSGTKQNPLPPPPGS